MIVFPVVTQARLCAMTKPVPITSGEQLAANKPDQHLNDLLSALRKPVKLTATLRRRALKNKAIVTSAIDTRSRLSGP